MVAYLSFSSSLQVGNWENYEYLSSHHYFIRLQGSMYCIISDEMKTGGGKAEKAQCLKANPLFGGNITIFHSNSLTTFLEEDKLKCDAHFLSNLKWHFKNTLLLMRLRSLLFYLFWNKFQCILLCILDYLKF